MKREDEMGTSRSVTWQIDRLRLMNEIVLEAAAVELRAAAFGIAAAVREMRPSASFVTLGPSGWDDGLVVVEWEDSSGVQHEESVAFLHDTDGEVSFPFPDARNIAVGEQGELIAVPTMSLHPGETLLYTLDIDRTLSQFSATPPIAEILRVHQSPTSDTVVTAVFGVPVEDVSLIEQFTVNAFTRPTWDQWVRHRDDCLTRASDSMRSWVRVAFFNPPGGHLIRGRQRRPWLQP